MDESSRHLLLVVAMIWFGFVGVVAGIVFIGWIAHAIDFYAAKRLADSLTLHRDPKGKLRISSTKLPSKLRSSHIEGPNGGGFTVTENEHWKNIGDNED